MLWLFITTHSSASLLPSKHISSSVYACVHLQGVWLEGSRAARGDPDAAASVPISPVERRCLPPTPLFRRQQDQIRGTDL